MTIISVVSHWIAQDLFQSRAGMYAEYWGLAETPFKNAVDPRWFFESPGHEEALARLLFLVEHRRRCGVISGGEGTGKSLILELVRHESARTGTQTALVDLVGRTSPELLWETLAAVGLWPGCEDAPHRLWRRLHERIAAQIEGGQRLVLIFDHLERAQADCISAIERIQQLSAGGEAGLTLLLGIRAQRSPEAWRLLREMSDLRIELPPFDREQTRQYVESLLSRAGAEHPFFDESAFDRLFDETHGVPREINRLCELSMLAGMAERANSIDDPIVAAAAEELRMGSSRILHPALADA